MSDFQVSKVAILFAFEMYKYLYHISREGAFHSVLYR
jgi:hypothetical protein